MLLSCCFCCWCRRRRRRHSSGRSGVDTRSGAEQKRRAQRHRGAEWEGHQGGTIPKPAYRHDIFSLFRGSEARPSRRSTHPSEIEPAGVACPSEPVAVGSPPLAPRLPGASTDFCGVCAPERFARLAMQAQAQHSKRTNSQAAGARKHPRALKYVQQMGPYLQTVNPRLARPFLRETTTGLSMSPPSFPQGWHTMAAQPRSVPGVTAACSSAPPAEWMTVMCSAI